MQTPVPDLRRRNAVSRLLHAAAGYLEARSGNHGKCGGIHCACYERMRVKVWVMFAVFVLVIGALIRREVLSYVPRTTDAPPPISSGNRLPGIDPAR